MDHPVHSGTSYVLCNSLVANIPVVYISIFILFQSRSIIRRQDIGRCLTVHRTERAAVGVQ